MIKIVEQSMLYDFYGELLNEHQKEIYEDVVFNDMSPSEIAREEGISRQGVHDLIKRCDKILKDYEEKLHLVRKFTDTRNDVNQIKTLISEFRNTNDLEIVNKIEKTTDKILSDI
ncbi:MAG: DNA-binding protein [Lachnospiraceae bacterium]|nr:DNA-binding protein [Lachnospiraceae bacterium]